MLPVQYFEYKKREGSDMRKSSLFFFNFPIVDNGNLW